MLEFCTDGHMIKPKLNKHSLLFRTANMVQNTAAAIITTTTTKEKASSTVENILTCIFVAMQRCEKEHELFGNGCQGHTFWE
jgi:hypothetical protein